MMNSIRADVSFGMAEAGRQLGWQSPKRTGCQVSWKCLSALECN